MSNKLKFRFLEFVLKNKLFAKGDRVLLAVSGGVDSMVLLNLLFTWKRRLKIEPGIVHLHHGIRGKAADSDFKFVDKIARKMNIPFFGFRKSVPEYSKQHKLSLEEAGYRIRRQIFEDVAVQQNYDKIATGHHLDDQAETILMRLIQGSGIQGLGGIRLKKGRWVRPLLFAHRREIEIYAEQESIAFQEDLSNQDDSLFRNKIRNQLLPLLQDEYNPLVTEHLANLSSIFSEWDVYIKKEIDNLIQQGILKQFKNKFILVISRSNLYFSWLKIAVIEFILNSLGESSVKLTANKFFHFTDWAENARTGSRFQFGGGTNAIMERGQIVFSRKKAQADTMNVIEVVPGENFRIGELIFKIVKIMGPADFIEFQSDNSRQFINGAKLHFPLSLRKWKPGDRFVPLGMTQSKLVSDYLTNKKISPSRRLEIYVLLNGPEIVSIIGIQISELYKVCEDSKIIYQINMEPDEEWQKNI